MLTREENRLLTLTGPDTPGGALMRSYWHSVALAEELGGAPMPVRILGEELVLFRDQSGRPGLLGLYCAHRCADLSYGRIENGGLRCLYHGWLYDVEGRCLSSRRSRRKAATRMKFATPPIRLSSAPVYCWPTWARARRRCCRITSS